MLNSGSVRQSFRLHGERLRNIPHSWVAAAIILASGCTIFTELAMIRLVSTYLSIFALLKNVTLLSCFLGLGIGYALAKEQLLYIALYPLFLCGMLIFLRYAELSDLNSLLTNPLTDQVMLGISESDGLQQLLTLFLIAAVFICNAVIFIPLGQLAGMLMTLKQNVAAYRLNLFGSIIGIALFYLISAAWLGGGVWIAVSAIMVLPFLVLSQRVILFGASLLILSIIVASFPASITNRLVYSPYQTLEIHSSDKGISQIVTNGFYYQRIVDFRPENVELYPYLRNSRDYYELPFRAAASLQDVLIVGSGAGNDVAAALRAGATRVTAVEIDPVIAQIGREVHPEAPYRSEKVSVVIDDARSFIKRDQGSYDAIVYGLLDSHTLLSGKMGGVRIDSYVYTLEALREARAKLNENGVLSLAFVEAKPAFARKLFLMLKSAFDGREPKVVRTGYDGSITFLAANYDIAIPSLSGTLFSDVTSFYSSMDTEVALSTDNWPFLYMTWRGFPSSYILLWAVILGGAIIVLRPLIRIEPGTFSWPSFFLGAAFMLLETKAMTEMALVSGTTADLTALVILCVLLAALAANSVIEFEIRDRISTRMAFTGLFASLLFGYLGMTIDLSSWPEIVEVSFKGMLLVLPIFFAGLCFSIEVDQSRDIGGVLSANLLGALIGGLLEYSSMIAGFKFLYIVATALYLFAFLSVARRKAAI